MNAMETGSLEKPEGMNTLPPRESDVQQQQRLGPVLEKVSQLVSNPPLFRGSKDRPDDLGLFAAQTLARAPRVLPVEYPWILQELKKKEGLSETQIKALEYALEVFENDPNYNPDAKL